MCFALADQNRHAARRRAAGGGGITPPVALPRRALAGVGATFKDVIGSATG